MAETAEAKFDPSVIGVEEEIGSFDITLEQIQAYCAAVGETNPLYLDEEIAKAGPYGGIIAPPGIVHSISMGNGPDAKIRFGTTSFHAGEKMEMIAPMYPGDHITAKIHVKELFEKTGRTGGMLFEVRRTIFTNQNGQEVVAAEKSFVRREVVPGGE
jgi:acyl dehydratase